MSRAGDKRNASESVNEWARMDESVRRKQARFDKTEKEMAALSAKAEEAMLAAQAARSAQREAKARYRRVDGEMRTKVAEVIDMLQKLPRGRDPRLSAMQKVLQVLDANIKTERAACETIKEEIKAAGERAKAAEKNRAKWRRAVWTKHMALQRVLEDIDAAEARQSEAEAAEEQMQDENKDEGENKEEGQKQEDEDEDGLEGFDAREDIASFPDTEYDRFVQGKDGEDGKDGKEDDDEEDKECGEEEEDVRVPPSDDDEYESESELESQKIMLDVPSDKEYEEGLKKKWRSRSRKDLDPDYLPSDSEE